MTGKTGVSVLLRLLVPHGRLLLIGLPIVVGGDSSSPPVGGGRTGPPPPLPVPGTSVPTPHTPAPIAAIPHGPLPASLLPPSHTVPLLVGRFQPPYLCRFQFVTFAVPLPAPTTHFTGYLRLVAVGYSTILHTHTFGSPVHTHTTVQLPFTTTVVYRTHHRLVVVVVGSRSPGPVRYHTTFTVTPFCWGHTHTHTYYRACVPLPHRPYITGPICGLPVRFVVVPVGYLPAHTTHHHGTTTTGGHLHTHTPHTVLPVTFTGWVRSDSPVYTTHTDSSLDDGRAVYLLPVDPTGRTDGCGC